MQRHVCKIIHGWLLLLCSHKSCRCPCYSIIIIECKRHHTVLQCLPDLCSLRNKYLPWMSPEWTGCQSLSPHATLSPPSRKPVLPSFELPQRDTHSSSRRLDSSSWVVSQSQVCSAAQCIGSWHRLTLQLLLSPVSTSGRGRRCRTTFCCVEHDNGRWRMGCRASCEHRESRAGFDESQESVCYLLSSTRYL